MLGFLSLSRLAEQRHASIIADFDGMAPGIDGAIYVAKRT